MLAAARGWGHGIINGGFGPGGLLNGGFMWMGVVAMLVQLLFWGLIVFLAFRFLKHLSSKQEAKGQAGDQALSILKERYAKGEIDSEEFLQRKKDLES